MYRKTEIMKRRVAANKQLGVMVGKRLRLNNFGLLKVRVPIDVYQLIPPQTPSCQAVVGY